MHKLYDIDNGFQNLGFGCAGLMRLPRKKDRLNLLSSVFDSGVRYFDVARMYGMGQVESELGVFLKGSRDSVTVATKFGISVSDNTQKISFFQPAVRAVANSFPKIKKILSGRSKNSYYSRGYSANEAQESLTTSLHKLGMDYVDILFIHEPSVDDLYGVGDALQVWLQQQVSSGFVKEFGVAGYINKTQPVMNNFPDICNVIQIDNDVVNKQIYLISNVVNKRIVTFSPFSGVYDYLLELISRNDKEWSNATGYDFTQSSTLIRFLLSYAIKSNPNGRVLFFTSNIPHMNNILEYSSNLICNDSLYAFMKLIEKYK